VHQTTNLGVRSSNLFGRAIIKAVFHPDEGVIRVKALTCGWNKVEFQIEPEAVWLLSEALRKAL
jgi:hypothetical protein